MMLSLELPRGKVIWGGAILVVSVLAAAAVVNVPSRILALIIGCLFATAAFAFWPWATLPLGVAGGIVLAGLRPHASVTFVIAVHVGILVIGMLGWCTRATFGAVPRRVATTLDTPMLSYAVVLLLVTAWGIAVGNQSHKLLVATYELGVIPAYYLVATVTLASRSWLQKAAWLFVFVATALAVTGFASPGRHGGFPSLIALPVVLFAAGRSHGARRFLLVAIAVILAVDTLLASYRATWLAAAVALLLMLPLAGRRLRRMVVQVIVLSAMTIFVGVLVSPGLDHRLQVLRDELHQTAGYRAAEANVGLHVFWANPLLGNGLGQTRHDVFLPTFRVTDVGPIYHVWYVSILANGGLVLALALGWILIRTIRIGISMRVPWTRILIALTIGFVISAAFGGPTDGHWDLGLLPALVVITATLLGRNHEPAVSIMPMPGRT